ncbi:hypothetical protein M2371_004298 [Buttiauxella sp. BIGb0471]|nr:hypothetical protein [Buttiauxella sp. BIGb0471]
MQRRKKGNKKPASAKSGFFKSAPVGKTGTDNKFSGLNNMTDRAKGSNFKHLAGAINDNR